MRGCSEFAGIKVPPHILFRNIHLVNACHQGVKILFTLAAADDLADFGEQYIHGADSFAILVHLHIKRFDLLRVAGKNNRFPEMFLDKIPFMFGLEVGAPVNGKFPGLPGSFENGNRLGIGEPFEIATDYLFQPVNQPFIIHFIQKLKVVHAVIQGVLHEILQKIFRQVHVIMDIVKGHLGFNHPEFGQVAWCI